MTRQKLSAGNRNERGRQTWDVGLGIVKTCGKFGASFGDNLVDRFGVVSAPAVLRLADLIVERAIA